MRLQGRAHTGCGEGESEGWEKRLTNKWTKCVDADRKSALVSAEKRQQSRRHLGSGGK